jgi:hypothetical protein
LFGKPRLCRDGLGFLRENGREKLMTYVIMDSLTRYLGNTEWEFSPAAAQGRQYRHKLQIPYRNRKANYECCSIEIRSGIVLEERSEVVKTYLLYLNC